MTCHKERQIINFDNYLLSFNDRDYEFNKGNHKEKGTGLYSSKIQLKMNFAVFKRFLLTSRHLQGK